MAKTRLDKLIVERGLAESRERAQALILAGQVVVGEHVADKAGLDGRGDGGAAAQGGGPALRLARRPQARARARPLRPGGPRAPRARCGASTGGFTDVLLQRGAAAVCALDVGYGQLAWKLRQDPRVTVLERTNIRQLEAAALPFVPDLVVCDVSFISLALVLPKLVEIGQRARWLVCLIKPQFEVGKGEVGKGGVVRDEGKRQAAVDRVVAQARTLGCEVLGVITSPITGPAGNVEYLLALRPPPS